MTAGSIAWVREGAFWAHLELPHTVLGDCVGLWGTGVRLGFRIISRRIWAHMRALVVNAAEQMGQLKFFVFFDIDEGGGWEIGMVGDEGTVGGGETRKGSSSSSPSRVSRKEEGE